MVGRQHFPMVNELAFVLHGGKVGVGEKVVGAILHDLVGFCGGLHGVDGGEFIRHRNDDLFFVLYVPGGRLPSASAIRSIGLRAALLAGIRRGDRRIGAARAAQKRSCGHHDAKQQRNDLRVFHEGSSCV